MARYEKGHKEATRKRIVRLASERFRKDGIDGVGVALLMADAGLTQGGFYAHFDSKEALVREAVSCALESQPKEFVDYEDSQRELADFIDWYLSPAHRNRTGKGCPIAALGPDLARRPKVTRAAFAKGSQNTMDKIAMGLSPDLAPEERSSLSYAVMAHLVGTIQLARLATDKTFSDRVLETGRRVARQIAGLAAQDDVPTQPRRRRAAKKAAAALQ